MTPIVLADATGARAHLISHLNSLRRAAAATVARHPFFWGVALMIVTTSLWALAFLAPLAVPDATAIEIALGRFIVYGLISTAALNLGRVLRLPVPILLRALVYALAGNLVYYVVLVTGIQLAGATMAVLIIGMLPVTVSVFGQLQTDSRALRALAVPFLLFGGGVIVFNAARTDFFQNASSLSLSGILCITLSLVMWTWYAVANARFLKTTRLVSAAEWSSVIGIVSLAVSLIGLPLSWSIGLARDPRTLGFAEFSEVTLWSVLLGGGSTWLGTILFNKASKLLDVSILGQLTIFEAIFGTIYVLAMTGEMPSALELAGIAVALFAVWLSIHRLQRHGPR